MDKTKLEYINELCKNDEITMYTKEGKYICETGRVHIYEDYEELCNDWLNTGLFEGEDGYRTIEHKEMDIDTYYDYEKEVWFAMEDVLKCVLN